MKLESIIHGITPENCISELNINFNGFNNCALGTLSLTDITDTLIGEDLVDTLNGNIDVLSTEYPVTKIPVTIGMSGADFISALNNNFNNISEVVLEENEELFDRMEAAKEAQENDITDEIKTVIKETILDLRLTNIWNIVDAIHFFNLHNRRASLLNWVKDDEAWWNSGASWEPKSGFKGDGISGLVTLFTGFVKYSQDSSVIGYFSDTNDLTDSKCMMISGTYGSSNLSEITIRTEVFQVRMNCTTDSDSFSHNNNIAGLVVLERAGATDNDLYIDGTKHDLSADASVGLPPRTFTLLGNFSSAYSKNSVSFAIVGSALGEVLQAHLKDIVYNFNTKIILAIPDNIKKGQYKTTKSMLTIRIDDAMPGELPWKAILDEYGVKAYVPVLTGSTGNTNYWGVAWSTIKSWYDDGWEIGAHGVDDTDLKEKSRTDALADIILSKQRLTEQNMIPINFVPHKYGFNSPTVRADIMKHFRSSQSGGIPDNYPVAGCNPQILDTADLSVIRCDIAGDFMLSLAEGVTAIKAQIDIAVEENRWLIMYFHSHDTDKESGLRSVIEYAQGTNIEIVTIQQGLDSCEII